MLGHLNNHLWQAQYRQVAVQYKLVPVHDRFVLALCKLAQDRVVVVKVVVAHYKTAHYMFALNNSVVVQVVVDSVVQAELAAIEWYHYDALRHFHCRHNL